MGFSIGNLGFLTVFVKNNLIKFEMINFENRLLKVELLTQLIKPTHQN
jgi:hypothetical protein